MIIILAKKKLSAKVPPSKAGSCDLNSDEMAKNAKRTTETLAKLAPLSIDSSKLL